MSLELNFTTGIEILSIPVLFFGGIFEIIFLILATKTGFKNIELHIEAPKNSLNCLFTHFSPMPEK